MAEFFEAAMVICFGCSWPLNLYKSIKTKSTKGKSLFFLILIDLGYVAGMLSKICNASFDWPHKWWVFSLYVLNFTMITADLVLYFINHSKEKRIERQSAADTLDKE